MNRCGPEAWVSPREKVGIQSSRHAQDEIVAAYSRLRYREALFRLSKP